MRIFITGHKGLIGSHLWEALKKRDYQLSGYDNPEGGFLSPKCDVIIHLGANCIIRDVIKDPILSLSNITSTFHIYELARKNKAKVVFFSSSRVKWSAESPYTASKKYGELLAKAYEECYGVKTLIIRPETVWGNISTDKRVIPIWIRQAVNNEPITVFGSKEKELSPCHVGDFIEVFLPVFDSFLRTGLSQTISISGDVLKVPRILQLIKKATGSKSKVIYTEPETSQPQFSAWADVVAGSFEDVERWL